MCLFRRPSLTRLSSRKENAQASVHIIFQSDAKINTATVEEKITSCTSCGLTNLICKFVWGVSSPYFEPWLFQQCVCSNMLIHTQHCLIGSFTYWLFIYLFEIHLLMVPFNIFSFNIKSYFTERHQKQFLNVDILTARVRRGVGPGHYRILVIFRHYFRVFSPLCLLTGLLKSGYVV